jgi:internalin A
MSALALQLIQEAKEKRLTSLDLGNCGLTKIPKELFELEWLEELNLGTFYYNNQLRKYINSQNKQAENSLKIIPEKIKNLENLHVLHLSGNQITNLSFLQGLTLLTTLIFIS